VISLDLRNPRKKERKKERKIRRGNDLGSCLNRSPRMLVNLGDLWDGILFMNPSNSLDMFTQVGSRIFLLAAIVW